MRLRRKTSSSTCVFMTNTRHSGRCSHRKQNAWCSKVTTRGCSMPLVPASVPGKKRIRGEVGREFSHGDEITHSNGAACAGADPSTVLTDPRWLALQPVVEVTAG